MIKRFLKITGCILILILILITNNKFNDVYASDIYTHIRNIDAFHAPRDSSTVQYLHDSIVKDQNGNVYVKLELKVNTTEIWGGDNIYYFKRWIWYDWDGVKIDGQNIPVTLKTKDYYLVKYIFIPLNKSWAGKQLTDIYYKNRSPEFACEYSWKSDRDINKIGIEVEQYSPLYINSSWWNSNPTITLSSPTINQLFSEEEGFNTLTISGTVKDQDIGNSMTVKYTIEDNSGIPVLGHNNKVIQSAIVSNGTSQSFDDLNITIDNSLPEGNSTLKVWVEDNNGGKSGIVLEHFLSTKNLRI